MSPSSNPRPRTILCYVTDRRSLPASPSSPPTSARAPLTLYQPLLQTIERATHAGVDWIQLREKDLSARAYATLTREAIICAQKFSGSHARAVRILVNDRLDVALAERAAGVHLGEKSLTVEEVKRLLRDSPANQHPENFLVGVSCHSLESAVSAANAGADYIFFGPVFATPSKAAYGAPQGLGRLAAVCHSVPIPVLAIGGITSQNASSCLASGASGIAAIRLFQDAADLAEVVQALRTER